MGDEMKLIPASLSTALVLHEVLSGAHHEAVETQPHVDYENNFPRPSKTITGDSFGGNGSEELPGHFRQRMLYKKSLAVKKTRNPKEKFEMLDAFVDAAQALAREYPYLKPWERQMHFQMFQAQVGITNRRTRGCKDFSAALPLVANALGVSTI
jgi:hypothetical protein